MAAYEVLLLNTAVPQIQAAQSGDTYVVPRDIAFSAVANLANGTYLLPALAFSSDPDTGIFRQGANQLGFTAGGGTDQMVLTSTGLGIGTSSPATKLDVNGLIRSAGDAANFLLLEKSANTGVYARWKRPNREYYLALDINNNGGNDFSLYDATAAATRWTVDASGNLGLGVTPSAWVGFKSIDMSSVSYSDLGNIRNAFWNGSAYIYRSTAAAAQYQLGSNGAHAWLTAPSGTAGSAISFTQAMTLEANGDLAVGTTGASGWRGNFTSGSANKIRLFNTTGNGNIIDFVDQSWQSQIEGNSGNLFFKTGGTTERARITSDGYFKSSNNGTYQGSTGSYHEFTQTGSATTLYVRNSVASGPFGLELLFSAASPDDNTQWFLKASDSTTTRCYIWSDGDLANHDGVYGTISDQKLKQDIVDAGSQWDDLKAIRFRKYRMKSDVAANPDAPVLLGVIAQELEQVSPGLVDEHPDVDSEGNDLGTTTKTVKSSILLMKAAVALQEAMARIEHLEAKVSALESKGA